MKRLLFALALLLPAVAWAQPVTLGSNASTMTVNGAALGNLATLNSLSGLDASATTTLATGGTAARTLAARAADVINVREFGAACDNATDDSGAFNLAAAAVRTQLATTGNQRAVSMTLAGCHAVVKSSINWTGFQSQLFMIDGAGASIWGKSPAATSLATTAATTTGTTLAIPTTGLAVGMPVSGANIVAGSAIASIINSTSLTLSQPVTGAGVAQGATVGFSPFPVIDALGSRFLHLKDFSVYGDTAATPLYGIQFGRISSGLAADLHHFDSVAVSGNFVNGAIYNGAAEGTEFTKVFSSNGYLSPTAYALIQDGLDHWNISSAFQTVVNYNGSTTSFNEFSCTNCALETSGGGSPLWESAPAARHHYGRGDTYMGNSQAGTSLATTAATASGTTLSVPTSTLLTGLAVTGTNIPAGTTIASIINSASLTLSQAVTGSGVAQGASINFLPVAPNRHGVTVYEVPNSRVYDLDLGYEETPPLTDLVFLTGTNPTPLLQKFTLATQHSYATGSVFSSDAGITSATVTDANVWIGVDTVGATMFNPAIPWTVDGHFSLPDANNWNLTSAEFTGEVNLGAGWQSYEATPTWSPPPVLTVGTINSTGSVGSINLTNSGGEYFYPFGSAALPSITLGAPPVGGTQATAVTTSVFIAGPYNTTNLLSLGAGCSVNDILSVQGGRYIGSNPQRLKVLTIGTGGTVATFGPTFGDIDYTVVPAQPALLTGGTCTTPPTLGSASGIGMSIATTQITAAGSGYTTAPSVTFGSGYVTATGTAILNTSMSISAGTGAINLTSGGVALTGGVSADTLRVTPGTPADNATCTAGQVGVDANYVYACTAANTWKRAALSTY